MPAAFALPVSCAALLGVGALAAAGKGALGPDVMLALVACVVA